MENGSVLLIPQKVYTEICKHSLALKCYNDNNFFCYKEMDKTKRSVENFETQPYFDEFQILESCTKKLIHKVHIQLVKVNCVETLYYIFT